jgi:hypothetical protein
VHHLEDVCSRLRGFVVEESVVLFQTFFAFVATESIGSFDDLLLSVRCSLDVSCYD